MVAERVHFLIRTAVAVLQLCQERLFLTQTQSARVGELCIGEGNGTTPGNGCQPRPRLRARRASQSRSRELGRLLQEGIIGLLFHQFHQRLLQLVRKLADLAKLTVL